MGTLSPTQNRLASSVGETVSRFLELFKTPKARLRATQILMEIVETKRLQKEMSK